MHTRQAYHQLSYFSNPTWKFLKQPVSALGPKCLSPESRVSSSVWLTKDSAPRVCVCEEQVRKVAAGVRTTALCLITGRVGVFVIPSEPQGLIPFSHKGIETQKVCPWFKVTQQVG